MKEAENWFMQAEDDLEKAHVLFENKKYDGAAFFSQQAVEKGLKSFYLTKNKETIKTHDLTFLAKKINAPEEIRVICSNINPVYVDSRYVDFMDEYTCQILH